MLLDTHHSPRAAQRLVAMGFDTTAAAADPDLAVLDDESLLLAATADDRALVAENARDFDRIARAFAAGGQHHAGIIFTSPQRFHRAAKAYPTNIVAALKQFLADPPVDGSDWVWWL